MYTLTKLPLKSRSFIYGLNAKGISRTLLTSIAVGKVIAHQLPLPPGTVDNIVEYYNTQNYIDVMSRISVLNEKILLDTEAVKDYVLKFFQVRYESAYSTGYVMMIDPNTAVLDFFKISKHLEPKALEIISSNPIKMTELVNGFVELTQHLSDVME